MSLSLRLRKKSLQSHLMAKLQAQFLAGQCGELKRELDMDMEMDMVMARMLDVGCCSPRFAILACVCDRLTQKLAGSGERPGAN